MKTLRSDDESIRITPASIGCRDCEAEYESCEHISDTWWDVTENVESLRADNAALREQLAVMEKALGAVSEESARLQESRDYLRQQLVVHEKALATYERRWRVLEEGDPDSPEFNKAFAEAFDAAAERLFSNESPATPKPDPSIG